MPRPHKGFERKTILGKKLDGIRGKKEFSAFSSFFGVSATTLSKYLNGTTSPDLASTWNFVLNYAAATDGRRIDLNWLADDTDRRFEPVYVDPGVRARIDELDKQLAKANQEIGLLRAELNAAIEKRATASRRSGSA